MPEGTLITIEGIDGAGKSTLARALRVELARRGVAAEVVREPGGVELAERIRELVVDPGLAVSPRAEALLYAAARAQLAEQLLRPRLAQGALLLLDRFLDSSLAYQGGGRGLGVEEVRALNLFATGGLVPDRTLLLRISPAAARERLAREGRAPDRLEGEGEEFFAATAAAYELLAEQEPRRIRVLDAAQEPAAVLREALGALQDVLPAAAAD